ncbi:MAG: glycoside hydrolase family 92 protein, partial [Saprospiraceae bacterium]|nr:glycoside hydrolase family 92 protein [Saprospiraceae bacterium]
TVDFINTFLNHYEQGGRLPFWELWGNETNCMVGYHAVSVIADAYNKGIIDFDAAKALEAMVAFAEKDEYGKKAYATYGFIPSEMEHESVSKTLEYSYNDWCISQMANAMGKKDIAEHFAIRSQSWKNLFDPTTGFFRARENNFWFRPFDPFEVNYHYTEANAWQYAFGCQHDLAGLATYFKNNGMNLEQRLDSLFSVQNETTGREQADITGLIGQYAQGNEPSHHIAYTYNYVGKPAKAQALLRRIMAEQYSDQPDGLSGNEDCGQMSAWYIMNALGLYQVAPGQPKFDIGSPFVKNATIQLENGKSISIEVENQGAENVYVEEVSWNGTSLPSWQIAYQDLIEGGTLHFTMTASAEKVPSKSASVIPQLEVSFIPSPTIAGGKVAFFEKDTIELNHPDPEASIWYAFDKAIEWQEYDGPIILDDSQLLLVKAMKGGQESKVMETLLFKIPEAKSLRLLTEYAPQYTAGGPNALIDYIKGSKDFRSGQWQGYEGKNLEAVLDYGNPKKAHSINIRFFQDENAWIFMPLSVEFYGSNDGNNFTLLGKEENTLSWDEPGSHIHTFSTNVNSDYQFYKIVGVNRGDCPKGHKSEGGKCWIFADELWLE